MAFNTLTVGKGNILKDGNNNQYRKFPYIKIEGDFVSLSEDVSNQETDVSIRSGLTTKGDLLVHNGTNITRLPVGANQFILTADSSQPTGLSWTSTDIGFATVNASFSIPAFNATVQINVSTTRWMNVGQNLFIQGAGEYEITAINSGTSITVRNISPLNPTTGQVSLASRLTPSGERGTDGINGFAFTTASFNMPNINANVTITVDSSAFVNVDQIIYVEGAGYFSVVSIPTATQIQIKNLGWLNNTESGISINTDKLVTASGIKGDDGISSFAFTTANFTVPTTNSNVTVSVDYNQGFAIGQAIYVQSAGAYEVVETNNNSLVIKNLGATGNATESTVINSGVKIVPGGVQGASGRSAISITTANFIQPAVNTNVAVSVDSSYWFTPDGYVFSTNGGFYQVVSIDSATQVTLKNIGDNENAIASTVINSGEKIVPSGRSGTDGLNGVDGVNGKNAYSTTNSSGIIPALNGSFNIDVVDTSWITVGQYLYFAGGYTFLVTGITGNTLTLENIFELNQVGATIEVGTLLLTGAVPGSAGLNAYTFTTANFVMPAPGTLVTVEVEASNWMNLNQSVFVETAGYFIVKEINSNTSVDLELFNDPLNAAVGTLILADANVSPAGLRGADSSEIAISLQLNIQTTDPTELAGKVLLYAKSDGLYQRTPNGTIREVGAFDGILEHNSTITFSASNGGYVFNGNGSNVAGIKLNNGANSVGITIKPPTNLSSNYTLELPVNMGTNGQVLRTDGTGKVSWMTPDTGSLDSITDGQTTVNDATAINFINGARVSRNGNVAQVNIQTIDTKIGKDGDLAYFNNEQVVRLPRGLSGQILQSTTNGIEWSSLQSLVDPHFSNVRCFIEGEGVNGSTAIVDLSNNNYNLGIFGNTKISTLQAKFRGSSIAFDGSGDYIQFDRGISSFPSNLDYTIEAWIYPTSYAGQSSCSIFSIGNDLILFRLRGASDTNNAGKLDIFYSGTTGNLSSAVVPLNEWSHVAVARQGIVSRLFLNGVLVHSGTANASFSSGANIIKIGTGSNGTNPEFYGYMSHIRFTEGIARYTASFSLDTDTFLLQSGSGLSFGLSELGDLLYHDGTGLKRLPKGANGQVLKSDSVVGLSWGDVSGTGDMSKSVYDSNNDGIVDQAGAIAGSPSPQQYYGTDNSGVKGFYDLPTGGTGNGTLDSVTDGVNTVSDVTSINFVEGATVVQNGSIAQVSISSSGDMSKAIYDSDNDGIVDEADFAAVADIANAIAGSPSPDQYYGTNNSGVKGFFPLPSGTGGSGLSFAYNNTNFTPTPNTLNAVDTIASSVTATLPLNPDNGTIISFYDYQSNFATNSFTILAPTGNNILGGDRLILGSSNATVQLIFYSNRWSVFGTEVFIDKVASVDTANIPYIVAGAIG